VLNPENKWITSPGDAFGGGFVYGTNAICSTARSYFGHFWSPVTPQLTIHSAGTVVRRKLRPSACLIYFLRRDRHCAILSHQVPSCHSSFLDKE